jgi:hypothetical protein
MRSDVLQRCWWLVAAFVFLSCRPVFALLVAPPASNDNTSAPVDNPGWLNVANRGVYLGNRWVLTAFHLGAGSTSFPGVGTFNAVPGSAVRLQNPSGQGLSQFADLQLYRLTADPGLPTLSLAAATPSVDAQVTLVGDGAAVTPAAMETHWQVTGSGNELVWTEVASGGNFHGYKATTFRKLWGTNLVEDDEVFFEEGDVDHTVAASAGFGDTISFFTEFDKPGITAGLATTSEAQGLSGDSGSAAFQKVAGSWLLAGLTHSIAVFEDQPNVGQTAVYGNLTFIADLSVYRDQIIDITSIPELGGFLAVGSMAALVGLYRLRSSWFNQD